MAAGAVEVAITTPHAKKAAILDGTTDYISVPHNVSLNAELDTDFSMVAWVKLNSAKENVIICKQNTGGGWFAINYYFSVTAGGALRFPWATAGGGFTDHTGNNAAVSLNVWHHVAAVYDQTLVYFYVDGVLDKSVVKTADLIGQNVYDVWIGQGQEPGGANSALNGQIASVQLFRKALSATEIGNLYNRKKITDKLISEWNFKDGTYNDSVGTNNGTKQGDTYIGIVDDDVAAAVKADRVTANDKHLIAMSAENQVITVDIEEA